MIYFDVLSIFDSKDCGILRLDSTKLLRFVVFGPNKFRTIYSDISWYMLLCCVVKAVAVVSAGPLTYSSSFFFFCSNAPCGRQQRTRLTVKANRHFCFASSTWR